MRSHCEGVPRGRLVDWSRASFSKNLGDGSRTSMPSGGDLQCGDRGSEVWCARALRQLLTSTCRLPAISRGPSIWVAADWLHRALRRRARSEGASGEWSGASRFGLVDHVKVTLRSCSSRTSTPASIRGTTSCHPPITLECPQLADVEELGCVEGLTLREVPQGTGDLAHDRYDRSL